MNPPRPVSVYPPATSRSLDDWLAPASSLTPADGRTRLREIAHARAADITLAACTIGGGIIALMGGVIWGLLAWTVVPVIAGGVIGSGLSVGGAVLLKRARSRRPDNRYRRMGAWGTPDTPVGGIILAGVIYGAVAIPVLLSWPELVASGAERVIGMLGFLLVFALLLVVAMVIPGIILGRARTSLRRVAATDPVYRAMLEQERSSWVPQHGDQMFGPL